MDDSKIEDVEKTLRELIAKIGETDADFSADADLREELGFDSYLGVALSFEVERVFKISIPPDRIPELSSLRKAVALVMSLKPGVK